MKKISLLLLSLLGAFMSGCQDHNLEPHSEAPAAWRAGGPESDSGNSIAVDEEGNLYVTGSFAGSVTFSTTTLNSFGLSDVFVVKYNRLGEVLWARQAGGQASDFGGDIALDGSGNVFVTGHFTGTATFGSTMLTSSGVADIFIVRYNSNGEVHWVKSSGGISNDQGNGIAVDKDGNFYITGSFEGTATFGSTSLTSRGNRDIFVAMYNSNGDALWAQQAGGTKSDGGTSIAVDESGNAYITGYYTGPATFGAITFTGEALSRATDYGSFFVKYSNTGEVLWARGRLGWGSFGTGIAVDKSSNVYVTGAYWIGPFTSEILLEKINGNGEVQWSRYIGEIGFSESGTDLAVDKNGNVYLIGTIYSSQISIFHYTSSGSLEVVGGAINLVRYGGADILVAKFDTNANLLWARSAGGTGNDFGRGIAVDANGTAYVTGTFEQTATFGSTTLTSAGDTDVFVAKFK